MRDLCERAIDAARSAGATYADVRFARYRFQAIHVKDRRVEALTDRESFGFGVRAIAGGAWGFAASGNVAPGEISRVAREAVRIALAGRAGRRDPVRLCPERAHEARWRTPYRQDPFEVPLPRKIDLLMRVSDEALAVPGVRTVRSFLDFQSEHKHFMNTDGSYVEQEILRSHPGYLVTAVGDGAFESRSYQVPPLNIGYEHVEACGMVENARRIAEEAVEKLRAPVGPAGTEKDLVLLPSHLWLTIHESVAHPTELDRALGWEADYAGTTFATPEKLGSLRFGSEKMNMVADRTMPSGRSTCGYDDDGVPTKQWDIVRNGIFVGYQTTRDTAPYIGAAESTGCSYADSWASVPFLRIPNLSLEADPRGPTPDELVADTEDGLLIDGRASYSIDQQRVNFQFGGDAIWEIRGGRRTRMVKDITYQAQTLDFWSRLDATCRPEFRELHGATTDGKGQPMQAAQQTHACAPSRFRRIAIGGAPR